MIDAPTAAPSTRRPKYPHLENLERVLAGSPDFLSQEVTVTEKVHGFNARVGRDEDGVLWYGGRSVDWDLDDPKGDALQGFRDFARETFAQPEGDGLPDGITLYGEWAGKGVQKGIDYGEKRFYLFAERLGGGPVLSSGAVLDQHWLLFGVTTVPTIYEGSKTRLDVLEELRKASSIIAPGQPIEGVVIAPVDPFYDRWHHQVVAKFKSPLFEEVTRVKRERAPTETPVGVLDLAETYVTPMRLTHVLDQVRESLLAATAGRLYSTSDVDPLDVQHTGVVLRTMYEDVLREAKPDYDALSPDEQKLVGKAVNGEAKTLLADARSEAAHESLETFERDVEVDASDAHM